MLFGRWWKERATSDLAMKLFRGLLDRHHSWPIAAICTAADQHRYSITSSACALHLKAALDLSRRLRMNS